MDPFFARNRLSAYIDGALSDAESAEVAEAIERDPELRTEFEALRRTVEALRRHGPVEAPAGFHARVMEMVRDEPAPGGVVVWFRRNLARVPVEAVALAAAAAIVLIVIQGRPGDTTPTAVPKRADRRAVNEAEPDLAVHSAAEPAPPPAETPAAADDWANQEAELPVAPQAALEPTSYDEPEPQDSSPTKKAETSSAKLRKVNEGKGGAKEYYQPEWEQQAQVAADFREPASNAAPGDASGNQRAGQLATPTGFRLSVSDSEVLFHLSALAEKSGGVLLDSAGRALQPRALDLEENYAQVQIVVPRAKAQAIQDALRSLGGTRTAPPASTPLHGADQAGFVIEVLYLQ